MKGEIQIAWISSVVPLIKFSGLLKVKTIKKKYIEQMAFLVKNKKDFEEFRVIGKVGHTIIGMDNRDRFVKCHFSDYEDYIISCIDGKNYGEKRSKAIEIMEKIPQIFED